MAGPAKSNQKVLPLASGPTSSGSLAPSLLQGPAAKGHPWPIAALAASMPLNPLRNDSARPPERGVWRRLWDCGLMTKSRITAFWWVSLRSTYAARPILRIGRNP